MKIYFDCQGCGKRFVAPAEKAGMRVTCKECQAVTVVPQAPAESAAPLHVAPIAATASFGDPAAPVAPSAEQAFPAGGLVAARSGGGDLQALPQQLKAINTLVEQRRFVEATQALKPLSEVASGNPGYHYLAGMAFSGLGNYPHALDHLSRAVSGGITMPPVYAAKGKAELELGQFAPAIQSLDTALDIAGTDVPDYMADLAKAYEGARMPRDAASTWAALAQISPNHPALVDRERTKQLERAHKMEEQRTQAMMQMQKEQKASDTACWICIILRILLECM